MFVGRKELCLYWQQNTNRLTMFEGSQGPCGCIQLRCLLFVSAVAVESLCFVHFQYHRFNICFVFLIYSLVNSISTEYVI